MSERKDLPKHELGDNTAPYWEAARDERLLIQQCTACDEHVFPPRCVCPYCLEPALDWVETSGEGTVYTYSTVYHPPHPAWEDDVPYTLAIVELEEGAYIFTVLENVEPEAVESGVPVSVTFDHVTDEVTLPLFEPAE